MATDRGSIRKLRKRNEKAAGFFLFNVDNRLLDNDRVQRDLYHHLARNYGLRSRLYIAIFEELRKEIGYADYLARAGALRHRIAPLPLFYSSLWRSDLR